VVVPGWHPNPDGTNSYRYWDGTRWTEHVQAPPPQASSQFPPPPISPTTLSPPSEPSPGQQGWARFKRHPQKLSIALGAAVLIVLVVVLVVVASGLSGSGGTTSSTGESNNNLVITQAANPSILCNDIFGLPSAVSSGMHLKVKGGIYLSLANQTVGQPPLFNTTRLDGLRCYYGANQQLQWGLVLYVISTPNTADVIEHQVQAKSGVWVKDYASSHYTLDEAAGANIAQGSDVNGYLQRCGERVTKIG
jgi:hypothetical protein